MCISMNNPCYFFDKVVKDVQSKKNAPFLKQSNLKRFKNGAVYSCEGIDSFLAKDA